jgi:hypothetical protein
MEGCELSDEAGRRKAPMAGYTFTRPGNAKHPSWESTIVGQARLDRGTLEVESNSTQRANLLRRRIEKACGDQLRHVRREETSGAQLFERVAKEGARPPRPQAVPDPELARVLLQEKEKIFAAWLDESIPALRGKTPRQAARLQRGRRELDILLKEMENREARLPEHERADIPSLRRKLGLSP